MPPRESSPGCRKGYLGDEVAHIGQDSPRCQVDFPVSGSDELLVESQVLGGTLASYAQFVQVTAMETDRALRERKQLQQSTSPSRSFHLSSLLLSFAPSSFQVGGRAPEKTQTSHLGKPRAHNREPDAINYTHLKQAPKYE